MNAVDKTITPRRAPKQARGERRIEGILDAAAHLFDEFGYEATTTIQIAKRANTAVGSLYDFYPNKESIAGVLVERFTNDLQILLDSLISQGLLEAPLAQVMDHLIDPLVQFIHTRPGFRALYLRSPHIGQLSEAQQNLEELFNQRMATLLLVRYPKSNTPETTRIARVCMETVKALTALAIETDKADTSIITDLKTMLVSFIQAVLESPPKK